MTISIQASKITSHSLLYTATINDASPSPETFYFHNSFSNTSLPAIELHRSQYPLLTSGLQMERVTRSKRRHYTFKLIGDHSTLTWKNGSKKIDLDKIKDIRTGSMALNYIEEYNINTKASHHWVSIIHESGSKLKCLHLLIYPKYKFTAFVTDITMLVKQRRDLLQSVLVPDHARFASVHWRSAVSSNKEDEIKDKLTFSDVKKLCRKFNVFCSDAYLKRLFLQADLNKNGLLNFKEFQKFVALLKNRPEIDEIWNSLIGQKQSKTGTNSRIYLSFEEFSNFLKDSQSEAYTDDEIHNMIKNVTQKEFLSNSNYLTKEEFLNYLRSEDFIYPDTDDYSQPITHYFIASSHNTYLLGKQIAETPTAEGYIQVLQQGCRSVEIDIWDSDSGPVVCHGILTTSIPLFTILTAIRKYAFFSSPYPLIISLEINCNVENQNITVRLINEIFANIIATSITDEQGNQLSPKDLKHQVILKSKKTKNIDKNLNLFLTTSTTSSYSSSSHDSSELDSLTSFRRRKSNSSIDRIRRIKIKPKVKTISDSLLNISGIYGIRFRNTSLPESKTPNHCFSLNEKKFDKLCQDKSLCLAIDKHNRQYFVRVYPHAMRYKSSNFNPIQFWLHGAQMVATNWQTYDLGQQLNIAMFKLAGKRNQRISTGYVLKPEYLRTKILRAKDFLPIYEAIQNKIKTINFSILSGQILPILNSSEVAAYATVELFNTDINNNTNTFNISNLVNGVKVSNHEVISNTYPENGFSPVWNCKFSFEISANTLTFVRLCAKSGDTILAMSCFRLNDLKPGYRHIPLYSTEGKQYNFSTLFIHSK